MRIPTGAVVVLAFCASLCVSCASYVKDSASTAATSAVNTVTDPQSKKEWDALVASLVDTARDQALGPDTKAKVTALVQAVSEQIRTLVKTMSVELRSEILATRDATLDKTLRDEVGQLREELLGEETKKLLKQLLATILAEAGPLREELLGAPLRQDATALLADVGPQLDTAIQTALTKIRADADAEITKYQMLLGVAGIVVVGVLVAAIYLVRSHRQVINALLATQRRNGNGP